MIELTNERIDKILHEETLQREETNTILRSIYTRYMRLYERYFEDIDALDDEKIEELKKYHEETRSLVKYYYMDIPQDICTALNKFEDNYSVYLLGPDWHRHLFTTYEEFRNGILDDDSEYDISDEHLDEKGLKEAFKKEALFEFYAYMDHVFREGFGTASQAVKDTLSGLKGLLFGKDR